MLVRQSIGEIYKMYMKIIKSIRNGKLSGLRTRIASGIMNGSIKKFHASRIIDELRKIHKDEVIFLKNASFEMEEDKTKWDKNYLQKIADQFPQGNISENLVYHMIDVAKYVNRFWICFKWAVFILIAVLIVLLMI